VLHAGGIRRLACRAISASAELLVSFRLDSNDVTVSARSMTKQNMINIGAVSFRFGVDMRCRTDRRPVVSCRACARSTEATRSPAVAWRTSVWRQCRQLDGGRAATHVPLSTPRPAYQQSCHRQPSRLDKRNQQYQLDSPTAQQPRKNSAKPENKRPTDCMCVRIFRTTRAEQSVRCVCVCLSVSGQYR